MSSEMRPTYVENPTSLFEPMEWVVAEDYECIEAEPRVLHMPARHPLGSQMVIRPKRKSADEVRRWRRYDPMRLVALDRVIAETDPTPDGICKTARKHGFLGSHVAWQVGREPNEFIVELRGMPDLPPRQFGRFTHWGYEMAEPFDFWVYHITRLRTIHRVRDLIAAGDGKSLKGLFNNPDLGWNPGFRWGRQVMADAAEFWTNGFVADMHPTKDSALHGHNWVIVEPAPGKVCVDLSPFEPSRSWGMYSGLDDDYQWINHASWALAGIVTEALNIYSPSVFRFDPPGTDGRQGMSFLPNTLLGAAYAHLVIDLGGQLGGEVVRCPGCGDYFYKVHGRQKVCSNRCRVRMARRGARDHG